MIDQTDEGGDDESLEPESTPTLGLSDDVFPAGAEADQAAAAEASAEEAPPEAEETSAEAEEPPADAEEPPADAEEDATGDKPGEEA